MPGVLDRNYDAPEYNITREQEYDMIPVAISTRYYAQFVARGRMYVTNIIIGVRSVFSAAALTTAVGHAASIAGAFSIVASSTLAWISATSVGSYHTFAINRTLAAGEKLGVTFTVVTGKAYVSYEYQLLPV